MVSPIGRAKICNRNSHIGSQEVSWLPSHLGAMPWPPALWLSFSSHIRRDDSCRLLHSDLQRDPRRCWLGLGSQRKSNCCSRISSSETRFPHSPLFPLVPGMVRNAYMEVNRQFTESFSMCCWWNNKSLLWNLWVCGTRKTTACVYQTQGHSVLHNYTF